MAAVAPRSCIQVRSAKTPCIAEPAQGEMTMLVQRLTFGVTVLAGLALLTGYSLNGARAQSDSPWEIGRFCTERVSVSVTGLEANDRSTTVSLSEDGRLVLFASMASNLVAGDSNENWDAF